MEDYYDYTGGYGSYDLNSLLNDTSWMNSISPTTDLSYLSSIQDPYTNWNQYTGTTPTGYDYSTPETSFLSGLGSTVGSLGSSLLSFLSSPTGKAALGLGGAAATLGGGTPSTTTNINNAPQMSSTGQGVFSLAAAQPTTLPQSTTNLLSQMDLSSMLNTFPTATWQQAEAQIPQTQAAREAALASKLGRVAPNVYSQGNNVQDMIAQVSKENDYITQLYTALLQAKAGAQQSANIQAPTQATNVLGLSNYPQTYTNQQISQLANILQAAERGTMGSSSTGTNTSLLTQLGGVLAGLASAK